MNIKKLCTILVAMVMFTVVANAQDVTKFLGIPVDGDPEAMRKKLIEKEFELSYDNDPFSKKVLVGGVFNGEQVDIDILTNKGKVWSINVWNKYDYSKYEAITKFNSLVRQFDAKGNYTRREYSVDTYYIPDDVDDVDFDGNVEKQNYKAVYYQENSKMKKVWFNIRKTSYGGYYILIHYENLYNEPKDGEDL